MRLRALIAKKMLDAVSPNTKKQLVERVVQKMEDPNINWAYSGLFLKLKEEQIEVQYRDFNDKAKDKNLRIKVGAVEMTYRDMTPTQEARIIKAHDDLIHRLAMDHLDNGQRLLEGAKGES